MKPKVVKYQIGVDIIGQPLFVTHVIYEKETRSGRKNTRSKTSYC